MSVQKDRPAWTDDRLDDLSQTMRDGLARLDAQDHDLGRKLDALNGRFDALQRTLILGMIGVLGTIVAGFAAAIFALA
ncbi:MAG: hypothetical protein KDB62_00870 [Solirubrobacterales bacterium]|nr:hypothetical protein [Solirubrobacterales bacterium]